ncbi:hypothetical protein LTR36_010478 [Oleoguttula mirabilis]|uniref:Uncharacterized protein n=1 Tax=Oleoguttula mirabilis TaxID=1507867 RepID=A0AAV9J4K4_9PEZI|nr:hypothetical protein LTR36_010478 [Oleoguttula mirabilis]
MLGKTEKNAQKNKLRRQTNAQKKMEAAGGTWVPPEQFAAQFDPDIKLAALIDRTEKLQVPDNVRLDVLLAARPDWFDYLLGGTARVDKRHDPLLNRAIWYNELDSTHTFNYDNKRCKAADTVINRAVNQGGEQQMRPLLITYHFAVREQRFEPDCFTVRDYFIKRWLATTGDIIVFSQGDLRKMKQLQQVKAKAMEKTGGLGEMRGQTGAEDSESDEEGGKEDPKMAALGEELGALMLSNAGEALADYVASTANPDPEVMDAILAPAMDASKEASLALSLKGLMINEI